MSAKRSRREFEADLRALQSPYVFFGTPLPPLDASVRDDGSYVPIWKQEVTDERGRKRLHGAFTGGYSAGYFNTVGSKEGWTPATFVSSRSNRRKDDGKGQRPEDFMDEEDLVEAAEAQHLQTQGAFAGLGGDNDHTNAKPGLLMDLLRPQHDTMGVRLLQKMGWREGQGIGPKVRRQADLEDYEEIKASQDGANHTGHLFAPTDVAILHFMRKNDVKGLGFSGGPSMNKLDRASSLDDVDDDAEEIISTLYTTPRAAAPSRRTGLGAGILNDDSDEGDGYEMGPKISYTKAVGSAKKKKGKTQPLKSTSSASNPTLRSRPVFISQRSSGGAASARRCFDGQPPLDGFILAEPLDPKETEVNAAKYELPKVPDDWQPAASTSGSARDDEAYKSVADAAKTSTLDAQGRASLLGEARLPGKSVFDYLTPEARNRLAAASGKAHLPAGRGEKGPETVGQSQVDAPLPSVDKGIALSALTRGIGGWMPYSDDQPKQKRYKAFLEHCGGINRAALEKPADTTRDSWVRELGEFAHAAEVFKPITGAIASKFTSSSTLPGTIDNNDTTGQAENEVKEKPEDPAESAARIGMYGSMTRSMEKFYPARLLCKRFAVAVPAHVEAGEDAAEASKDPNEASKKPEATQKKDEASEPSVVRLAIEGAAGTTSLGSVVDASTNEALEGQRAADALFKSIFGDDEDGDM